MKTFITMLLVLVSTSAFAQLGSYPVNEGGGEVVANPCGTLESELTLINRQIEIAEEKDQELQEKVQRNNGNTFTQKVADQALEEGKENLEKLKNLRERRVATQNELNDCIEGNRF